MPFLEILPPAFLLFGAQNFWTYYLQNCYRFVLEYFEPQIFFENYDAPSYLVVRKEGRDHKKVASIMLKIGYVIV